MSDQSGRAIHREGLYTGKAYMPGRAIHREGLYAGNGYTLTDLASRMLDRTADNRSLHNAS